MYRFTVDGQILRTEWYWKSKPYSPRCPDCDIKFKDKADAWAHTKFHIIDYRNKYQQLINQSH